MVWFAGSANSTMPVTFGSDRPFVAMATKICDFQHKIDYSSANAGDTPQVFAPTRGFSVLANLMVSATLCKDDTCCHGNENWEFHQ